MSNYRAVSRCSRWWKSTVSALKTLKRMRMIAITLSSYTSVMDLGKITCHCIFNKDDNLVNVVNVLRVNTHGGSPCCLDVKMRDLVKRETLWGRQSQGA